MSSLVLSRGEQQYWEGRESEYLAYLQEREKVKLTCQTARDMAIANLKAVLFTEHIHSVFGSKLRYSNVRESQIVLTHWDDWTDILIIMCAKFPDSLCITWDAEVLTVRELYNKVPVKILFSDPQMGLFLHYFDAQARSIAAPRIRLLEKEVEIHINYYFSVAGPSFDFVRVQRTDEKINDFCVVEHGGFQKHFSYREGCGEKVDNFLSSQLFSNFSMAVWKKPLFKDEEYYESASYGMWTAENHRNQVERVLRGIPSHVCVIAPGDGLGVVAALRKNKISGDMAITPMTHCDVKKESITATLLRGLDYTGEKVFVLSYIASFMTDSDWSIIKEEQVIVVDSNHVVRSVMSGTLHIGGPGVVSYGIDGILSDVWEFRKKIVAVNYTENLLTASGFDVEDDSPAVSYLLTVAPGKRLFPLNNRMRDYIIQFGCVPAEQPFGLRLVNKLVDLVRNPVAYFAPIGRQVEKIPLVDLPVVVKLPYRTVLKAVNNSENVEKLKQSGLTWVGVAQFLYFFYDKENERQVTYSIIGPRTKINGVIKFCDCQVPFEGVIIEPMKLTVIVDSEIVILGLKDNFVESSKLDDIPIVTPRLIALVAPFVPLGDRELWGKFVHGSGGWVEFKRRAREKHEQEVEKARVQKRGNGRKK